MGGQKQNDPESLRQGGDDLGSVGDRIQTTWEDHVSQTESMGDPFGDDMVGGLIGAAHAAVMQIAGESFGSGATDFQGFGEGLKVAGDVHEANEEANTQGAGNLGEDIEGVRKV